jgi:hypothetical protein
MKIGIMQPYFFPYFPYFQLINSVDIYVNLDHVNFKVRSYMTRNVISEDEKINISVYKASQNKKCFEIITALDNQYVNKFFLLLKGKYSNTLNYHQILSIFQSQFNDNYEISISQFNFNIIKSISSYLGIKTLFIDSSIGLTDFKGEDGIIDIVKKNNGRTYINAIGGREYYSKNNFESSNIDLKFLETQCDFQSYSNNSILDILFHYSLDEIKSQLDKYILL